MIINGYAGGVVRLLEVQLEADRTLDYATPPPKLRRQPYWIVLFVAWIVSFPVVETLDQFWKRTLYGGAADGTGTTLAMFGIVPAIVIAGVRGWLRWWVAALVGGLCAPVAITALYLLWR